jgi:phenylalanyl-tRNA synthetase alpha chain
MSNLDDIDAMRAQALGIICSAASLEALEAARVAVLGRSGSLTLLLKGLGQLPKEERAAAGKAANELRAEVEAALGQKKAELEQQSQEARFTAEALDISLPGRAHPIGSRHLISRLTEEIVDVFRGIGYRVVEGTEADTAWYNFTALNSPPDHPSRSLQDTFYIVDRSGAATDIQGESEVLLRPQTSGVQIHTMENDAPPIYMLAPGRVYRRDVADPSHLPQFTQIEGLVVDKGITFGDLKGTLEYFCREVFGPNRKTRFRPHFFPFTEPSAEVDVSCGICGGKGCRFCKGTGWLEILGCGMVDPNVFGHVGIDPDEYSGFAFGLGIERIACLKYNVSDLRMLLEGDMRFLRQF